MNPFTTGPASREYQLATAGWFTLYGVILFTVAWAVDGRGLAAPWVYPAAVAPALPIAGFLWTVLRFMDRSDEYVRAVLGKTYVIAVHLTLLLCVAWGFLEVYAGFRHLALFWVFPVFWVAVAVTGRFIRTTR
ncbi:MAG: hypothetical protein KY446_06560 [Proteobacteria bacterium]|nr:hypothetical protein [Pseudomonadota bacterium]MBW3617405.1 hypothetical protein [Pseudomonadota bacterium]